MNDDQMKRERLPKWAMSRANQAKLARLLAGFLQQVGGQTADSDIPGLLQWTIETLYGMLTIRYYEDQHGTIFCRFAVPHDHLDCNPHTGKWNFHHDSSTTPQDAIQDFTQHLGRILVQRDMTA